MPTHVGPSSNEYGLVFGFDTGDTRNSYLGEPTTNLIPNAPVNALPTYGNGWSTYNTNQYCGNNGCAVFWTIPAISSVSDNIVTTVSAHQIRSFDVIRPETTGGGVTANVDYVAKKISDTQFSLHAYNSSQDGSQGYINPQTNGFKVHDSYWLDERVSINSSGFPTKWWGAPHLPNSAIVKEIIPGGFDVNKANRTNCIRLHWFRSDATDGMAYGVDPYVTIGQPVTVSFWARAASASAVGQNIGFSNYNYGGPAGYSYYGMTATWGALGQWVRNSYTFTPTHNYLISYWFPSSGNMKVDIANIQIEQKGHATPFTTGSRTNTGSLIDLKGGSTIDLSNVSYDSNAQIVFDGTNDSLIIPNNALLKNNNTSIEFVIKYLSTPSGDIIQFGVGSGDYAQYYYRAYSGYSFWNWYPVGLGYGEIAIPNAALPLNKYHHIVMTGNIYGDVQFYINGVIQSGATRTANSQPATWTPADLTVGGFSWDGYSNSQIPYMKIYDRILTASEIQNNFNNLKGRFNI